MEKSEGESTCRTSSSSIVSSNEDLMMIILSWLPVKVLLRFRCVCKQWSMLISDPYFVSTHQCRATQDPNILKLIWRVNQDGLIRVCSIEEKEERKVTHDLIRPNYPDNFLRRYCYAKMVGRPCNGLICLEDRHLILVCNPATQNTLVIPRGKKRRYNYLEGLGFCSSSNEFKVVGLFERSNRYGCELFTVCQSEAQGTHSLQPSRSWKDLGDLPCFICHSFGMRFMCHVNGRVHWIIEPLSQFSSEYIISLDLELEEFKLVSCPDHWPDNARYEDTNLIDLGGELCSVFFNWNAWDIWVLKDYTNSIWSKEYEIGGTTLEYPLFDDLIVVGIQRRRLLVIINNSIFCYYDPINNSLEVIMEEYFGSLTCNVVTYIENLIIPY
ncbi:hypothetical protein NE237_008159 [Protea cynaroides]|uniref:F-box domain-containing protein n=1 Tax=Protea cynaroides TaxID=273540 RepID=A0A9Q0QX57_9MAGN|nr:hypothetical protein NE237_008159 [Protea cynaroides]